MTAERLRVERVTKSFGHIEALTNVSLTINEGEIVGLVGSNGAGKTTLLRLLAGVYTPTDGAVVLSDGSKVEDARHRLGVVPESTGLYSRLTAWENIRYHSRLYGTSDEESWNRTVFFADRLDMKESLGRHTKGFSRGMRQKTALLRALAHAPDILLLDEPTVTLDRQAIEWYASLMKDYAHHNQRTVIIASNVASDFLDQSIHFDISDYKKKRPA